MILNEVKEEYVKDLISKNQRVDGRKFDEYRAIKVEKGIVPNAEGSALAHIGDTKVVAGVKFDLMTPFKDRPNEGVVMFNAEFTPVAHPNFNPGPPNEHSIELARVVDRGIRSAETIDVKKFFIEEEKVYGLFVDLYVLDNSGNLIDTAALAAMAALRNTKVPKYEDGSLVRDKFSGNLELSRDVVATSVEKIDGKFVVDANDEEEVASNGRLTLATCSDDLLCAGQKSGRAGLYKDELLQLIDLVFQKRKDLVKHL
ncbi:MAG: RNA-binding protein [Candidatus Micrarchaeia archaeon]